MQFKDDPTHEGHDFMEIPPYGPFEKKKEGGGNMLVNITQNKEDFFKNYNELCLEEEEGTSKFRYVDRVRILYSIILDVIDLSELTS
jgi:hypothetical protein